MQHKRGVAGALLAPLGDAVRSYPRALPRRAFRPAFALRVGADMPPPRRTREVTPLGGGRFRVVTTLVTEQICTEDDLLRLSIPVPAASVPWTEEPSSASQQLRRQPEKPLNAFGQAMAYWREHLGSGFDPRLPKLVPQALDEFGLEPLLRAMDRVKAQAPEGGLLLPKYERLKRALQDLRDEKGALR